MLSKTSGGGLVKFLPLMFLAMMIASCVSPTDSATAVDIDAKVYPADTGDGVLALWVVRAGDAKKLEPLMESVSVAMIPKFSPDKVWLAVEDEVLTSFVSLHLFYHEQNGGFRRIPEEDFLLKLLGDFYATYGLSENNLASSSIRVKSWARNGKSLELELEASSKNGDKYQRMARLELTSLQ